MPQIYKKDIAILAKIGRLKVNIPVKLSGNIGP